MSISRFFKELMAVIFICLITIGITNYFLDTKAEWNLSFIGIILYTSLSVLVNFLGNISLRSENKYGFISLIMANVLIKMIASIAAVGIYFKLYAPDNKFFVLPFLLVYLIFTVFETSSLMRQADIQK